MASRKIDQLAALARAPIGFEFNEVWRVYTGGKLFRALRSHPDPQDSYFPEDWVASMTRAYNPQRDGQPPLEGLSIVRGTDIPFSLLVELFPEEVLGAAHLAAFGPTTRVLAKFLDSLVRLPIQAHPDDELAQRFWKQPVGKTEAWIIVDTRVVDGVEPYILLGFRPGIESAHFRHLVEVQDLDGQVACLNRIPVRAGDAFLVTGRTAHAIGSGVLMIEVQQPSDLVVQTESKCADYIIPEELGHMGLGWDRALQVFDYTGITADEMVARARLQSHEIARHPGAVIEQLIAYTDSPFFASRRLRVSGELKLTNERFYAAAVVAGAGKLTWPGGEMELRPGDTAFVPNSIREHAYRAAGGEMQIITADPPAIMKPGASDVVVGKSHTSKIARGKK